MELSIIIVNYRTPLLTIRCIDSIQNTLIKRNYEIIIVDNDSQDNSESEITEKFPEIVWINNSINEGFGRANNLGVSKAKGKYILLLNSDMIVLENTINECLDVMVADSRIGVLGCKLLNEDGSFQKSKYFYVGDYMGVLKYNLLIDYFFKPKENLTLKAVMGAFMLIPKTVFDDVRGFDPDFFMYAEELDLCRRISNKGYTINYTEKVVAIHKHGGSSEASNWSLKQNYLSNALLYLKTRGLFGYLVYHNLMIFTFFTNFFLIWKMDKNYRKDFWRIHYCYFSNFVNYLKIPYLYNKSLGNGKDFLKAT